MNIKVIVTHKLAHLDDHFAIWLLKTFGNDKFPDIGKARVEFVGKLSADFNTNKYPDRLFVGIGNGMFDEHPDPSKNIEGKKGECASTLVAEYLEVDNVKPIVQMLEEVRRDDLEGGGSVLSLAKIISAMKLYESDFKVMYWAFAAFDAKYQEQLDFFTADEEFKKAKVYHVNKHLRGKTLKLSIVSVASDSKQVSRFTRHKHRTAVFIQRNSSGNVQIFFDKSQISQREADEIVKVVRIYEQLSKKDQPIVCDVKELSKEGSIKGSEKWYYPSGWYGMFNGSLTHEKDPTNLSLGELVEAVQIALGNKYFPRDVSSDCMEGTCKPNGCVFSKFKLGRCSKMQSSMSKGKKDFAFAG